MIIIAILVLKWIDNVEKKNMKMKASDPLSKVSASLLLDTRVCPHPLPQSEAMRNSSAPKLFQTVHFSSGTYT